jgi:ABC-type sugar transport system ATPase subunit
MSESDLEPMAESETTAPTEAEATENKVTEDVVLRTNDLTKYFGSLLAVNEVSLDVKSNEILAIAGDNGAGKSTFVKMLSGVLEPTAGEIYLRNGDGLAKQYFASSKDAIEGGIATVYQEQHLNPALSAASNIFLGKEPLKAGLRGKIFREVDKKRMAEKSTEQLNEIGFDFDPYSPINELSGGQKQAVAVARALVRDPPIIILDEPTSEVSATGTDKIIDLVRKIPDEDKSVILISHKIDVVVGVADRIAVMRDGKHIETLDTNEETIERMDIVERMHEERET